MPLLVGSKIYFIYSINPLIIFQYENNKLIPVSAFENNPTNIHWDFHYSGSTNGISYKNGYLFIIHRRETYGKKISFTHFFIYLNKDFKIIQISEPFLFERSGIEFAVNLQIHDGFVYISYGLADRICRILKFEIGHIETIIHI